MNTYQEVKKQIEQLLKKAAVLRKAAAHNVIAAIKRQIAEFDLTAADLGFGVAEKPAARKTWTSRRVRAKVPPKYMDPATGKTWNGIGKSPMWIRAATKKGRRDDFLIERVMAGKESAAGTSTAAAQANDGPRKAAPKAAVKRRARVQNKAGAAKKPAAARETPAAKATGKARGKAGRKPVQQAATAAAAVPPSAS